MTDHSSKTNTYLSSELRTISKITFAQCCAEVVFLKIYLKEIFFFISADVASEKLYSENLSKITVSAKLYIPSTLNTDYLLWHTQLIVCAVKY